MPNNQLETPAPLDQALRRWVVIAGYVIGSWFAFEVIFLTVAYENMPLHRVFHGELMTQIFRRAAFVAMLTPFALLAGCWGFQHRRPWGRLTLLLYATTWITCIGVTGTIDFISRFAGEHEGMTGLQFIGLSFGSFDQLVFGAMYPALLLVYLTRPEFREPPIAPEPLPAGA